MISEEDKKLMIEAKGCASCPNWLKYCKAECCKMAYLNLPPIYLKEKGKYLRIKKVLSRDDQWYWQLRGVRYVHGTLMFEKKYCVSIGDRILYRMKCNLLTDENLCGGHPDKKPKVCMALDENTEVSGITQITLTPNCLFKYKKMEKEVNVNG